MITLRMLSDTHTLTVMNTPNWTQNPFNNRETMPGTENLGDYPRASELMDLEE